MGYRLPPAGYHQSLFLSLLFVWIPLVACFGPRPAADGATLIVLVVLLSWNANGRKS